MYHNCNNATIKIKGTTSIVTGLGYSMTPNLSQTDKEGQQRDAAFLRSKRQRRLNREERQHEDKRDLLFSLLATAIITCIVAIFAMIVAETINSRFGYEEAIANHSATMMTGSPTFLLKSPEEDGVTSGRALLYGEHVTCTGETYSRFPAIGRRPVVVMVKVTTEEGSSGWIAVKYLQIRASA